MGPLIGSRGSRCARIPSSRSNARATSADAESVKVRSIVNSPRPMFVLAVRPNGAGASLPPADEKPKCRPDARRASTTDRRAAGLRGPLCVSCGRSAAAPCWAAASQAANSGSSIGSDQQAWLRTTSKVQDKPPCEGECNGSHEKARCHGSHRADGCSDRPFDEPPGQGSNEHRNDGRHDPTDRRNPSSSLEAPLPLPTGVVLQPRSRPRSRAETPGAGPHAYHGPESPCRRASAASARLLGIAPQGAQLTAEEPIVESGEIATRTSSSQEPWRKIPTSGACSMTRLLRSCHDGLRWPAG